MHNTLGDQLGIEYPIFAFTHSRDVVVAVSKAGVLGAVGFTPEQLREELDWIDRHIGDKPLQGMVTFDAVKRTKTHAGIADSQKVAFDPVGQVVGQINHVESTRQVMQRLLLEYVDAVDRVNSLIPQDT